MKNLSSLPSRPIANRKKYQYPSEIINSEIADWHSHHRLPRHISALEIQSHRGKNSSNRHNRIVQPRVCAVDACKPQQPCVAFDILNDILKYQMSDPTSLQKHQTNLLSNLKHRLQVAKAQGNIQLWDMLQDEYRQLIS